MIKLLSKKKWYLLAFFILFQNMPLAICSDRKNVVLVDKQFAVFKVEENPYFSQDVSHLMSAIAIVNCAFDQQGKKFFFRWAPHLMNEQNWVKDSTDLLQKIKNLDLNELAFLGKIIQYEKEQALNIKANPSLQKKLEKCSLELRGKIKGQNDNLNSYLNSLVSFYSFVVNHLDKGGSKSPALQTNKEQDKEDPIIKNFIDSIAKKYVHDVYHF